MEKRVCRAMPDCGRSVVARGLCELHYRQELRGEAFRAVPRALVHGRRMKGLKIRVSDETRAALGEHPHRQARLVLEEWAKAHLAKKRAVPLANRSALQGLPTVARPTPTR